MLARIVFSLVLFKIAFTQEFSLIGNAIEAYSPCENGIVFMERIIGGRPSKENYWDGYLNLKDKYPNISEARLGLELNAPATVKVDPEEGRVLVSNGVYHISFFKPDGGYKRSKFRVDGKPFGKFPNIKSLTLNNVDVCSSPKQWSPAILGIGNTGVISDKDDTNNDQSTPQRTCGRRLVGHQGLIKDGHLSKEGDWPWHAAIFHQEGPSTFAYKCGGTLINTNTVLTASHCVIENGRFIIPERVVVKLGMYNRVVAGRNAQEFKVFRIIPHEDFDFTYLHNDIAILKLSTEATYTNYVQPICLWSSSESDLSQVIDKIGEVVGWGYFNEENTLSEYLAQGTMPVVASLTCLDSNRNFYGQFVSNRNFCAGYRNGTSVCNGDSGGGMFFKRDGNYHIRGIVSLSMSLTSQQVCNPLEFVIFTDVAKYLDWIEANK